MNFMSRALLEFQRRRLRGRIADNPLKEFLQAPLAPRETPFDKVEFVCLDIETTGLDPQSAEMLSVGWVLIRDAKVELGTAESHILRPAGEVGVSATVHGLTDTFLESGDSAANVLRGILDVLCGRVLVVHYAGLDKMLLDRLCLEYFGGRLLVPVVDTLQLEYRRQRRRQPLNAGSSLRLADLRAAYHLPYYAAHDSLVDAIATAELLLAMVASHGTIDTTTLNDLLGS